MPISWRRATGTCAVEVLDHAELVRDRFDGIDEGGEALDQVEDAAQADAVDLLLQDAPADAGPVLPRVVSGVPPTAERGVPAQPHGEEVGVEADFVGFDRADRTAEARLKAAEGAFDDAIEYDGANAGDCGSMPTQLSS